MVDSLFAALEKVRGDDQLAIILVEQNARLATRFSPRTLIMDRGRIVYDGPSRDLIDNPDLLERHFGMAG